MTLRPGERDALGTLCKAIDCDRLRIHRDAADRVRRLVLALSRGRAVALGNHVFLPDGSGGIPVLAHELTHCGQYQSWGALRYYARGVRDRIRDGMHRLDLCESPYRYAADGRSFDAYGMEQQGQIVEDCYNGDAAAWALSPYRPARRHDPKPTSGADHGTR